MPRYDADNSLRAARQLYFESAGFDESGYTDRFVRLKAGPFTFGFPNTAARVRAIRFHDLHHVLTEYDTTWTGEAEIAGWEIASGCADHYAAWLLNMYALAIGLAIAPRAVWRAFVRGRHSCNLYAAASSDPFLERRVGDVRGDLALAGEIPPGNAGDAVAFTAWSVASVVALAAPLVLLVAAVAAIL
jgi:hypothetical protein